MTEYFLVARALNNSVNVLCVKLSYKVYSKSFDQDDAVSLSEELADTLMNAGYDFFQVVDEKDAVVKELYRL